MAEQGISNDEVDFSTSIGMAADAGRGWMVFWGTNGNLGRRNVIERKEVYDEPVKTNKKPGTSCAYAWLAYIVYTDVA